MFILLAAILSLMSVCHQGKNRLFKGKDKPKDLQKLKTLTVYNLKKVPTKWVKTPKKSI